MLPLQSTFHQFQNLPVIAVAVAWDYNNKKGAKYFIYIKNIKSLLIPLHYFWIINKIAFNKL